MKLWKFSDLFPVAQTPQRKYKDAEDPQRFRRLIWLLVYHSIFKHTPHFCLRSLRIWILRGFGAKIGYGCKVAPSCFVWAPWNLIMGNFACLGNGVDCYSVATITLEDYTTVSQRAFLCTASHDISSIERPLFFRDIRLCEHSWVCAESFVGPGVNVGRGAVLGAKSVVTRDVEPWAVMVGNPARKIKSRTISTK